LAVGVALVSGGVGIIATLAATRTQAKQAAEQRAAVERDARIDRFARVLGPIQTLLLEMNPAQFVTASLDLVEEYRRRWLPMLEQLETVAVTEPSFELRASRPCEG
jgi:hypothetical protein